MAKISVHYDEQKEVYYFKMLNMIPSDEAVAAQIHLNVHEMRKVLVENFNATIGGKDRVFQPFTTFSTSNDIVKAIRWLESVQVMGRLMK